MANNESGHASFLNNFATLIACCSNLPYNPANPAISLTALNTAYTKALNSQMALQSQRNVELSAINARQDLFKPLAVFCTALSSDFKSFCTPKQAKDVQSLIRKITGQRAKTVSTATTTTPPTTTTTNTAANTTQNTTTTPDTTQNTSISNTQNTQNTTTTTPDTTQNTTNTTTTTPATTQNTTNTSKNTSTPKKISVSQRSYAELTNSFSALIKYIYPDPALGATSNYFSNDPDFSAPSLEARLLSLQNANTAVANAEVLASNALAKRNSLFYNDPDSLYELATRTKSYLTGQFKDNPTLLNTFASLSFRKPSK